MFLHWWPLYESNSFLISPFSPYFSNRLIIFSLYHHRKRIVSSRSDTNWQLHGFTRCLRRLLCIRPSGNSSFGNPRSCPSLHFVHGLRRFVCAYATILPILIVLCLIKYLNSELTRMITLNLTSSQSDEMRSRAVREDESRWVSTPHGL